MLSTSVAASQFKSNRTFHLKIARSYQIQKHTIEVSTCHCPIQTPLLSQYKISRFTRGNHAHIPDTYKLQIKWKFRNTCGQRVDITHPCICPYWFQVSRPDHQEHCSQPCKTSFGKNQSIPCIHCPFKELGYENDKALARLWWKFIHHTSKWASAEGRHKTGMIGKRNPKAVWRWRVQHWELLYLGTYCQFV